MKLFGTGALSLVPLFALSSLGSSGDFRGGELEGEVVYWLPCDHCLCDGEQ